MVSACIFVGSSQFCLLQFAALPCASLLVPGAGLALFEVVVLQLAAFRFCSLRICTGRWIENKHIHKQS